MSELPAKYLEGVSLFNQQEFLDCHEVLEELWIETAGPEKLFLQGLIQAAVALYHFGNDNFGGARKLSFVGNEEAGPLRLPLLAHESGEVSERVPELFSGAARRGVDLSCRSPARRRQDPQNRTRTVLARTLRVGRNKVAQHVSRGS
ncbi:MAG: hypothetical protein CMJ48_11025 [Planctomycetaceae bacterium]|nr:hypothetical protein [Planctomycetaceae bacterium]